MRGHIERRGRDSWRITISLGRDPATGRKRRIQRTIRGTRDDADAACARLIVEHAGSGSLDGWDVTFGQLLDRWLNLTEPDLSPTTVRDYRSCITVHLKPHLGDTPLRRLTAADLDDAYTRMTRSGLGAARVHRAHSVARRALGQAVRWRWITENPAVHASPPAVTAIEVAPPPPELVADAIRAVTAEDPAIGTFLHLAAATGARRGELVALRWSDIDLDQGEVLISRSIVDAGERRLVVKDTKTHQARRIALAVGTVRALRDHRRHQLEQRQRRRGDRGHALRGRGRSRDRGQGTPGHAVLPDAMSGLVVAPYIVAGGDTFTMPYRQDVMAWSSTDAATPTMARFQSSACLGGGIAWQGSAANANNGDYFDWYVSLAAGTYTLTVVWNRTNSSGKGDWKLDGTLIGTIDYNGTDSTNNVTTFTGVTVAADGNYTLRVIINGTNGTDYLMTTQAVTLHRTGA